MRVSIFIIAIFLGITPAPVFGYSKSGTTDSTPEQVRSTMHLKKYMSDFGILVAGMEIMRFKEKKPDWEAISLTLGQMEETLNKMREADKDGSYKGFTDILDQNLKEVQSYGEKRDKKIYDSFDKLTNTCFKCHAQHRPSDYLVPKEKQPLLSQTTSLLFQGQ
jgi:CRISPR/Cas system CSM-associated protein Csm2 small subunit